jgi:hypothetical protein
MITWSRLLGGGVRDPLVGGHLLIGGAFGVGFAVWNIVVSLYHEQSGALDTGLSLDSILDARHMTSVLDRAFVDSIIESLFLLLFFSCSARCFGGCGSRLPPSLLSLASFIFRSTGFGQLSLFDWVTVPLFAALLVFILTRFGVLALLVAFSVSTALQDFPLTADFSTWYAGSSLFAMASVLASDRVRVVYRSRRAASLQGRIPRQRLTATAGNFAGLSILSLAATRATKTAYSHGSG